MEGNLAMEMGVPWLVQQSLFGGHDQNIGEATHLKQTHRYKCRLKVVAAFLRT